MLDKGSMVQTHTSFCFASVKEVAANVASRCNVLSRTDCFPAEVSVSDGLEGGSQSVGIYVGHI